MVKTTFRTKVFRDNTQAYKILVHLFFFWIRSIIFVIGYIFPFRKRLQSPKVYLDRIDDLSYVVHFNLFLLYLVVTALLKGDIFRYYLSIFWMVHNGVLMMRSFSSMCIIADARHWIFLTISASTYILEALVSIYFSFRLMYLNNFVLHKKVGLNPNINDAFANRKFLETFGEINMYTAFAIFSKVFFPPKSYFEAVGTPSALFMFLTIFQQAAISIFFSEENVIQRRIAIFLTVLKLPLILYLFLFRPDDYKPGNVHFRANIYGFFYYIFIDVMFITSLTIYFLIKDYLLFGSGLKEYLKFKTIRLTLNSHTE